ncbi:MAG: DinB family protein [Alicyclobacillus herbarius]|uniref:DinB family protein n=1 Tax=Alicyclobacillus herbarius TaxID=122960 RepID=UPI0023542487|nr:DinB family protein [Alicyclobacillus herbarius]MCL6631417.1 DinB family protein [Alicyclobacillus herbarius]
MSQVEQVLNHWLSHRQALMDLLAVIPSDKADFRPWEKAMSVKELALHVAGSTYKFVTSVAAGRFEPGWPQLQAETMEETRRILAEYTEKSRSALANLSTAQLDAVVDAQAVFGFSAPGSVFLTSAIDHEIHHKGQLFVYARLVGVESVPFFVKR